MSPLKILACISLFFGLLSSSHANYSLGYNAYISGDYQEAAIQWREAAGEVTLLDDIMALTNSISIETPNLQAYARNGLGYLYENGFGVLKSYKKALELYNLSAVQGLPDGQYNFSRLVLLIINKNLIEDIDKKRGYKVASMFLLELDSNTYASPEIKLRGQELWNKYKMWQY